MANKTVMMDQKRRREDDKTIRLGGTFLHSKWVLTLVTGYTFSGWSGDLTGNANPAAFLMGDNKTVTAVTFVPLPGTLIIKKQTDPQGSPERFTFTGDVDGNIMDGQQLQVENLTLGRYSAREVIPAGWDLVSIVCDDNNSIADVNTATVTFQLDPGETITAVYTNRLQEGDLDSLFDRGWLCDIAG